MKQPKKLTYSQKQIVAKAGYNVKEWALVSEISGILVIVNKQTGERKTLYE